MTQKKVGIGLIGYAFMGKAHSNAYRQVARFFEPEVVPELRAICGRTEANVKQAAQQFGWESYETDYRRLLEREDIDIIDIATPGFQHLPMALDAVAAGKTVICEKPLGNTLAEATQMYEAAETAGVVNMTCFNYRRAPAVALAKRLIEDGTLGKIYHFRARYLQDWIVDPEFPLVWRLQKDKAGSGVLGDLGAHITDLAHYLIGNITSVSAVMETFIKERPLEENSAQKGAVTVDDAAIFIGRFENGVLGSFEASRFALGRKNHNTFEINGSKGSIVFDLERLNELQYYNEEDAADRRGFRTILATNASQPYAGNFWPDGHIIGYEHTFITTIYDLLNGHAKGESPQPDFRTGAQCNAVLDTVEKSATSKRWEDVPQLS